MKKNKLPNVISVLILTLITIIMWISFNVYWAVTGKPTPSVTQAISDPIDPTLDTDTINKIESSLYFDSSQIPQNVVTQTIVSATTIPTIAPGPTAAPIASASASPTGTPTP